MGTSATHLYFVFMNFDPDTKQGAYELDLYLSNKHDDLLSSVLEPGSYKKRFSWVIVDGFAVEITDDQQAEVLRSVKEVRVVEKNQELG
ncbi:subtilisin-like protease SBT2.5 isoform X3 [Tasmannia lanceolata]|uniref:subtilisin-like protease SBT2.5 isoform X3 n=1 Tax=Tasmannia lanceolata TaxID=3420 RepID=UPI004063EC1F